jgi:hypothetical protein
MRRFVVSILLLACSWVLFSQTIRIYPKYRTANDYPYQGLQLLDKEGTIIKQTDAVFSNPIYYTDSCSIVRYEYLVHPDNCISMVFYLNQNLEPEWCFPLGTTWASPMNGFIYFGGLEVPGKYDYASDFRGLASPSGAIIFEREYKWITIIGDSFLGLKQIGSIEDGTMELHIKHTGNLYRLFSMNVMIPPDFYEIFLTTGLDKCLYADDTLTKQMAAFNRGLVCTMQLEWEEAELNFKTACSGASRSIRQAARKNLSAIRDNKGKIPSLL